MRTHPQGHSVSYSSAGIHGRGTLSRAFTTIWAARLVSFEVPVGFNAHRSGGRQRRITTVAPGSVPAPTGDRAAYVERRQPRAPSRVHKQN